MAAVHKNTESPGLAAIFVHAGAGYHSTTNEQIHLKACAKAASLGMLVMKNGGSSMDAVEMALKYLEDNEVTNAGYGSNLTMDGTVECDATIVDHLGRSGAVGAIAGVENPICVARIVYEDSVRPLSLRRVPPNLLTGSGAAEFAVSHGFTLEPNEKLVSQGAKERFRRWQVELNMAQEMTGTSQSTQDESTDTEFKDVKEAMDTGPAFSHNTTLAALANESQPFSPEASHVAIPSANHSASEQPTTQNVESVQTKHEEQSNQSSSEDPNTQKSQHSDNIIDTVGAIAIDESGRIAAGSSSGGIGMKHSGRTGPAALVGIGTAVLPIDPDDDEKATVACITSGTGEHMASTMAAQTCAQRVYTCTKLEKGGALVETEENDAMRSFVQKDFMGHPAIQASHSAAAIGAVVVKKCRDGMWMYWVHNTDSFAMACMHAEDPEPYATMSRNVKAGHIVTGARSMRRSNKASRKDKDNAKTQSSSKRRKSAKTT